MPKINNRKNQVLRRVLTAVFTLTCLSLVSVQWLGIELNRSPAALPALDFSIEEISKKVGIQFIHQALHIEDPQLKNVEAKLVSGGSNVSVVDINGDGWPDIYLTNTDSGHSHHLYINQKNGKFRQEAEKYGLDSIQGQGVVRTAFFDCDNDGKQELLVTTVNGCPVLLKQTKGGKYRPVPFPQQPDGCYIASAVNVFDIDRNGYLDVVLAGQRRIEFLPESLVDAENGGPTEVFTNAGGCQFREHHDYFKGKGQHFTNAIGLGDLRNQGKADIWFATDFNDDKPFIEASPNSYKSATPIMDKTLSKHGMNSDVGYLDNNEIPSVYVSQVYKKGYEVGGNNLWMYQNGRFVDQAKRRELNRCGWSWGAKFLDLNNDGHLDIVVANGDISHPSGGNRDYLYHIATMGAAYRSFMKETANWWDMRGYSLSGHQRDCVFLNYKGQFVNIAEQLGFDREKLDGRGVALIDFDRSGSQSIVVGNQMQRLYFYKVQQKNDNHWVGFNLIGRKSNRDAIGAKVKVWLSNGTVLTRELYPFNGFASQSEKSIHFGLGLQKVERATVFWPSGIRQDLPKFKVNAYNEVVESDESCCE